MRFLFRVGDGALFYDCYDRKVYIVIHVVAVGGLSRSAFLIVEDYNGWLSHLSLRVCNCYTEVFVGGQVLVASEQLDYYVVVVVYRKSKTYTPHLTT